jgi:hypothetical protein
MSRTESANTAEHEAPSPQVRAQAFLDALDELEREHGVSLEDWGYESDPHLIVDGESVELTSGREIYVPSPPLIGPLTEIDSMMREAMLRWRDSLLEQVTRRSQLLEALDRPGFAHTKVAWDTKTGEIHSTE